MTHDEFVGKLYEYGSADAKVHFICAIVCMCVFQSVVLFLLCFFRISFPFFMLFEIDFYPVHFSVNSNLNCAMLVWHSSASSRINRAIEYGQTTNRHRIKCVNKCECVCLWERGRKRKETTQMKWKLIWAHKPWIRVNWRQFSRLLPTDCLMAKIVQSTHCRYILCFATNTFFMVFLVDLSLSQVMCLWWFGHFKSNRLVNVMLLVSPFI